MPKIIIEKFKDEYGIKKGQRIYYATANKQDRNSETFRKVKIAKLRKSKKRAPSAKILSEIDDRG